MCQGQNKEHCVSLSARTSVGLRFAHCPFSTESCSFKLATKCSSWMDPSPYCKDKVWITGETQAGTAAISWDAKAVRDTDRGQRVNGPKSVTSREGKCSHGYWLFSVSFSHPHCHDGLKRSSDWISCVFFGILWSGPDWLFLLFCSGCDIRTA